MRAGKRYAAIAIVAVAAVIQFIQPDRTNPPENPAATFEALTSPAPEAAAAVRRACQDCHSHRTVWPWYSRVAPVSWLVAHDVEEGRAKLNLSQWSRYGAEMSALRRKSMCKEAREGDMPLWQYTLMHSAARLKQEDIEALCAAPQPPKM